MPTIIGVMEDQRFIATRNSRRDQWRVEVTDIPTDTSVVFDCSDEQLGAILALTIAGEFINNWLTEKLYSIAEPIQEDMNLIHRMIS